MSILIADAIQDIQQELNIVGQKVSDTDFLLFFNRANKYFYTNYKMPTTQRNVDMLLFDGVREYSTPSDFVGFIELERPYDLAQPRFYHNTEKEIVHNLNGNKTAFKFEKETQFLIVNYGQPYWDSGSNLSRLQIHNLDSIADNGTWAVSGDGSSLAVDEQYFTEGTGSLRFSVTYAGGTITLVNSDMAALDLTDYVTGGFVFLDLHNPSDTAITSVRLRIGSDASNYYEVTSTTRYRGDTLGQYYGQVGFDLSQKTTTGTPSLTEMDYVQLLITIPSGVSGLFRVDNLFIANPTFFKLPYYSKYNVKSTLGTYQEKVTATSDTLLCPADCDEAFTYKVAELAASLKMNDPQEANYFRGELEKKEAYLRSKYPSQEPRATNTYYRQPYRF